MDADEGLKGTSMMQNGCVLVCVTMQKDCARLIHKGREIALESGLPLHVLHVSKGAFPGKGENAEILNDLFSLAHDAEAEMHILYDQNVSVAIAHYARQENAQAVVLGRNENGAVDEIRMLLPTVQIVETQ